MSDRPIIFSAEVVSRFWAKVDRNADCWEWRGPRNAKGYGRFHASGASEMAHRTSVRLDGRDIPNGMEVDHICRNRGCVNPSHLRVVTHRENLLSGDTLAARAAAKTECRHGHPLSGDNMVVRSGRRRCRECARIRSSASYEPTTERRRRRHLTKEDVAEIRGRIAAGESHSSIAVKLGVSIATVSNVRNGRIDYGR